MTLWCKNCDGEKIEQQDVAYPSVNKRPWCNKCKPCSDWCDTKAGCDSNPEFNTGSAPKNIPIFNTTYVGRAKRHMPNQFLDYYDCTKQRGGSCGSTNNIATNKFKNNCSAGRCEYACPYVPEFREEYLEKKKDEIKKHNNNYPGSSKKMEYARYVKRTPGTETFANKKQKVPEVKAHVNAQLDCFSNYWCKDMRL